MPYAERIKYAGFVENQKVIESKWDKRFGDRQNELVIIGQELDKDEIISELQACLCTENEVKDMEVGLRFKDPFPEY
jgi:G3E family GTPase